MESENFKGESNTIKLFNPSSSYSCGIWNSERLSNLLRSTLLDFGGICRKLGVRAVREDSLRECGSTGKCPVRNRQEAELPDPVVGELAEALVLWDHVGKGRKGLQLESSQQSFYLEVRNEEILNLIIRKTW